MSEQDWLKNLKPGDEVIVIGSFFHSGTRLAVVRRLTPSGMIVVNHGRGEQTFHANGWERTSGRHRAHLEEPTQERRERLEHAALSARLNAVKWRELPLETLRAVRDALDTAREEPTDE